MTKKKEFNSIPFKYHQEIIVKIEKLTNLGYGVARVNELNNWVVFVPFSSPGESIRAKVFRNHSNYSEAEIVEIIKPSEYRIEPKCKLYGKCGGCQYQHLDYSYQLKCKKEQLIDLLDKMGSIKYPVNPVIASDEIYHYRSKITPHFKKPKNNTIGNIGFLHHGKRQEIIDVEFCPIASKNINNNLPILRQKAKENASTYKKGSTLLLRESLNNHICTHSKEICDQKVNNVTFSFYAGEFFQNNPSILSQFINYVKEESKLSSLETSNKIQSKYLIDAYCGSGLFSLTLAPYFEKIIGIEISQSAIDLANYNAIKNKITNVNFIAGDAFKVFNKIDIDPSITTVIIDPPRKGSNSDFFDQLISFAPIRIIYVSCNPATQIRDLDYLKKHYEITQIQPFDFFPQTRHLECVISLKKLDN